jgi:VWFA-related protein
MFMKTRRSLFVLPVLALISASAHTAAQQAPVPAPGVIRINVNLVQVDAVVTDSKGKPVTDLRAEDFEIFQDKKAQRIRNFEFVRVRNASETLGVRANSASPSSLGAVPSPPSRSTILRPDQIRRTIALVVDDIALSFDGTVHVRDTLKKWVDTEMQPGDLVSLVRTNAGVGALQQFTGDKRILYAAIDRLRFQPGRIGVESITPFGRGAGFTTDPQTGEEGAQPGIDTSVFDAELQNAYLMGSFNAIKYVMQGLRDLPGRKSLILFSEDLGLPSLDSSGQQRRAVEDRLRLLAEDANRASVVIYGIDPRGVIYTGTTVSDTLDGREEAEVNRIRNARAESYNASQDAMVLLTQKTGGLAFSNSNDLGGLLNKAVADGDGYYVMGYQPELDTFDLNFDSTKYHTISVRVKRPGLKVRSRTGFYGLSDGLSEAPAPKTPQAQIAKALVSPFTTADLRVRLTTLFSNSDKDGSYLQTLLHFDARDLTFAEDTDGARSAAVDIAVVTFDENGDPAQTVHKTWSLRVPKEGYDNVLRKGLVYSVPVPVKKAGPYQLRVAIRDATSQKLGSAMQFVEVPDVKSGRLALSGIVLTADGSSPADSDATPAVRIFQSGGAISYAYEILNVRSKAPLQKQVRLYRDGQLVFEGPPSALDVGSEKEANRLAVGGHMQLTKIPPGEYVMQVVVFDSLRKDKSRVASQSIDFEVRP